VIPKDQEADDEVLVRRFLANGNDGDFERLVDRYQQRVLNHVLGVLGPEGSREAEDVCQDVFVRLHSHLPTFRFESRFGTWLFRMVRNAALDHRRRMKSRGLLEDPATHLTSHPARGPSALRAVTRAEGATRLGRAIEKLPEAHRSAVHLHYWLGLSVAEISQDLGVREGTVKSYLHRARNHLRATLAPSQEEV
jgi:RNA polymerase sigma-70 factor (ECF subfamily)